MLNPLDINDPNVLSSTLSRLGHTPTVFACPDDQQGGMHSGKRSPGWHLRRLTEMVSAASCVSRVQSSTVVLGDHSVMAIEVRMWYTIIETSYMGTHVVSPEQTYQRVCHCQITTCQSIGSFYLREVWSL